MKLKEWLEKCGKLKIKRDTDSPTASLTSKMSIGFVEMLM